MKELETVILIVKPLVSTVKIINSCVGIFLFFFVFLGGLIHIQNTKMLLSGDR